MEVIIGEQVEIQSPGVASYPFADALEIDHGMPTPNWRRFNDWIDGLDGDDARAKAWGECEVAWLQYLEKSLGSNYRLARRDTCLILSSLEDRALNAAFDFMVRTSTRIARVLDGIAKAPEWGHDILIVFDDQETYYRFVSRYYPDAGEFSFSSGMHISHGCSHFATTKSELRELEPVIAHEMTHGYLAYLPLPAWLNEGIAVNTEHRVTTQPTPLYTPQEMHQKHLGFWGETEIQEFWSGQSFHRSDDGNMLSYDLGRILVAHFSSDWARFRDFVCNADIADSGANAATQHLGISLGAAVASILGQEMDGDWEPNPALWQTST